MNNTTSVVGDYVLFVISNVMRLCDQSQCAA